MKEELYDLADHIARSKGALPLVWQDWASEIEMAIRKLANREAQPSITDEAIDRIVVPLSPDGLDEEKHHCEWHLYHDRERIRKELREYFAAPPAPAVPERLPCPVHLLPGLKFGEGVPTRSMLDALVRRAEYEAELEAMTPEQRAENDARLEKLKALIPQPSLPGIITASMAEEKAFRLGAVLNSAEAEQFAEGWNACRAAMLQPVSQGYTLPEGFKLVPVESTDAWAERYCELTNKHPDGGLTTYIGDGTVTITFREKSKREIDAMLAAAPEGGNG
ncbi:hypothetical protein H3H12_22975 [Serratia marcescens]|uniref:hypothetical protein n=1 Tax=Serratia TaxID=613 RepID=UPI00074511A9|nr:hypothetical protein [Serratia marcescens]EME1468106.1 hypothetical protein [Serratia marcescens]MBN3904719.1 hypothetical protein [Serratia marcescens]MBN3916221.1 hypothetical protein [Serratia marcescens]MBN3921241.1 hypothetical protein [Serratia marcescens]MBN3937820.1 hypothetical protein [Serratia marcescens]